MQLLTIYDRIRDARAAIEARSGLVPQVGVILGSGLGAVSAQLQDTIAIPYSEIPHFHGTSVEGHAGQLLLGYYHGVPAVFLQGRFHYYEGYSMEDVVFPTRVICALGIHTLILTCAAGGVNTRYRPGDLMLIEDHINLMGDNPLKGKDLAQLGPRFPDMSEAYSRDCRKAFTESAAELGLALHTGVYAAMGGPTFETPAEIRMLRTLGADAVGMSTVPESIAANHLGVRVAGVSCITNLATGMTSQRLSHSEVVANSKLATAKLSKLLESTFPKLILRPAAMAPGSASSSDFELQVT